LYRTVLGAFGALPRQAGKSAPTVKAAQRTGRPAGLRRLNQPRAGRERAVIIACPRPPASADAKHGGAVGHARDIDAACSAAGLWPDAVLSGHAHLYQRFTRHTSVRDIPYVVAGSGGHNATLPRGAGLGQTPPTRGEETLVN